jgi:hypothetical protein
MLRERADAVRWYLDQSIDPRFLMLRASTTILGRLTNDRQNAGAACFLRTPDHDSGEQSEMNHGVDLVLKGISD